MSIEINKITNANVYVDGVSHLGKAEEVMVPDIKYKFAEHKALGMIGVVEFFSGIEKLEAKIKWNSLYPSVLKKVANPTKPLSLQIRSSVSSYESAGIAAQSPLVCNITGTPKNFPLGNYKQHDNVEAETSFTITYAKLEIAGEVIYEVDLLANILIIDGVDVLADYRSNLGI